MTLPFSSQYVNFGGRFAGVVAIEGSVESLRGACPRRGGTPAESAGAGVEGLFESLLSESFS